MYFEIVNAAGARISVTIYLYIIIFLRFQYTLLYKLQFHLLPS